MTPDERAERLVTDRVLDLGYIKPAWIQVFADAIRAAVQAEREACAKVAQDYDAKDVFFGEKDDPQGRETQTCEAIAQAIRNRTAQEEGEGEK